MSRITPSSIEKQLEEYRKRKQLEETSTDHTTSTNSQNLVHENQKSTTATENATNTSSITTTNQQSSSESVIRSSTRSSILDSVLQTIVILALRVVDRVCNYLYSLVAPDHLLEDESSSSRGQRRTDVDRQREQEEESPLIENAGPGYRLGDTNATIRRRMGGTNNDEEQGEDHVSLLPNDAVLDPGDDDEQVIPTWTAHLTNCFGKRSAMDWTVFGMKIVLWLVLWKIFIIWQFGAVYFLITCFALIGYNLRSGPRKPNEVSAYSVFNRDLRRIDGTVSADQLQREMLFL